MKEKLIQELIEATAKRCYFAAKCNDTFWFPGRFDADYYYWKAREKALIGFLETL